MPSKPGKTRPIPLVAMLLAWLVPGAGHAYLGRTRRAIIIFVTVSATFWGGIALGGVMTVDYQNERWWFLAEMLTGVHGLVSWHRSQRVHQSILGEPELSWRYPVPQGTDRGVYEQVLQDGALARRGLALVAPMDTVARAYAGVAGLLNLLCIFDVTLLALMGVTGEPPPPSAPDDRDREAQ